MCSSLCHDICRKIRKYPGPGIPGHPPKNIRLESFQYFIDYMHNQRSVLAYNDNEQRHILMQLTTFHFQLLL